MRKKLYALSMAFVMGISLCACAKTPDENIVANKNSDRLKEEAEKGADESNNLSAVKKSADEHYTYSYKNEDGTFELIADADVWLPDKETIPMYEVESAGFSQELITKAYDFLFAGEETYRLEGTDVTKSEVSERIIKLKEEKAKYEADDEMDPEERENRIQLLEESIVASEEYYNEAPEESTLKKVPVDFTLSVQENWFQQGVDGDIYGVDCQSDNAYFSVWDAPVDSVNGGYISYIRKGKYNYSGETGEAFEDNRIPELNENIGISYDDAENKAEEFFSAVGVDVELVRAGVIKGFIVKPLEEEQQFFDNASWDIADKETAWSFAFTRKIDGIPLAATASYEVSSDPNSIMWLYEQINVIVDKDGIHDLQWEYPTEVKNTVSDNVGILTYDEAKTVFEKMVPIVYEGEKERFKGSDMEDVSIHVNVDTVKLCLMRVKEAGNERKGVLTPAWVFYGGKTTDFHFKEEVDEYGNPIEDWSNTEETPYIVMAVNAVDGSVIDIVEGY